MAPTLLVKARDNPQSAVLGPDYGLTKVSKLSSLEVTFTPSHDCL